MKLHFDSKPTFKAKKDEFIYNANLKAKAYREFVKIFRDRVIPAMRELNGKVLNKTLADKITAMCGDKNAKICIIDSWGNKKMEMRLYYGPRYDDCVKLDFNVVCTDFEGCLSSRFNAEKTLTKDPINAWLDSFLENAEEYEDAASNYDKYVQAARELQDKINEFANEIPYPFRCECSFSTYFLK